MKIKLSILLMSFVMTNFVNAEYMAKIPLEKTGGGSLPDNSIKISNINLEKREENCFFYAQESLAAYIVANENNFFNDEYFTIGSSLVFYNNNRIYFPVEKGKKIENVVEYGWDMYEVCYTEPEVGTIYESTKYLVIEDYCPSPYYKTEEIDLNNVYNRTQEFYDESGRPNENYISYEGIEYRYPYCNTTEKMKYKVTQNTKTLETDLTYDETGSIISTIPEYILDYDNIRIYCAYQFYDSSDGQRKIWEVSPTSSKFIIGSKITDLESKDSKLYLNENNINHVFARGKLMESINGNEYYAICQWGFPQ